MPAFMLVDGPLLAGGDGVVPSPSTAGEFALSSLDCYPLEAAIIGVGFPAFFEPAIGERFRQRHPAPPLPISLFAPLFPRREQFRASCEGGGAAIFRTLLKPLLQGVLVGKVGRCRILHDGRRC